MNVDEMDKLVATLQRRLGRSWSDMVELLRSNNRLTDIAASIQSGDTAAVIEGIEAAAKSFAADTNAAFMLAQQKTASWLDAQVGDSLIRADITNVRAVEYMQKQTLETVQGVTQETREMIRRVMSEGISEGTNPLTIAREIRDSIGLTTRQTEMVNSYRASLEGGDFSNALGRELADGRYDRSILAAQRDGVALPQSQVNTMVDRYRSNAVDARAETIARTEGMRAANGGSHELFRSAVDDGKVKADQLVRTWLHKNRGKYNRDFHHVMNGQRRGLMEPFVSGRGALLMFPGDASAGPEETVNCRCTVTTRYVRNADTRAAMMAQSTDAAKRRPCECS